MSSKTGDQLAKSTSDIRSRDAFCAFLEELAVNYCTHPGEWANADLKSFLEALAGFSRDMDGYYSNFHPDIDCSQPSWRVFADMIMAARVYE